MTRTEKFIELLQESEPSLKYKFKNESLLMKILGFILFFNKPFMTHYVTTIGSTIYFPKDFFSKPDNAVLPVIAHEFRHVKDSKKYKIIYELGYLFPISLIIIFPFLILLSLWALLLLLCLLPFPSPGRMFFELRGYTMSLFAANECMKEYLPQDSPIIRENLLMLSERYNEQFTTANYYFMWPFGVLPKLNRNVEKIIDGTIKNDDVIYTKIADAIKASREFDI